MISARQRRGRENAKRDYGKESQVKKMKENMEFESIFKSFAVSFSSLFSHSLRRVAPHRTGSSFFLSFHLVTFELKHFSGIWLDFIPFRSIPFLSFFFLSLLLTCYAIHFVRFKRCNGNRYRWKWIWRESVGRANCRVKDDKKKYRKILRAAENFFGF